MTNPDVFILCNSKIAENESSAVLATALQEEGINCYRVTPGHNPRYSPERVRALINYGVSQWPIWGDRLPGCSTSRDEFPGSVRWFNEPNTVRISANKLRMFRALADAGIPTLDFTEDQGVARVWMNEGHTVVSRGRLEGCDGAGIVLSPPDPLPDARLYTKLFAGGHVREYRAFVVGGRIIDLAERRRWVPEELYRRGIENTPISRSLRTYSNGWIFARNTMDASLMQREQIKEFSQLAVVAFQLGLGSVDTIVRYNERGELTDIRVVETNTQICLRGDTTTRRNMAHWLAEELKR